MGEVANVNRILPGSFLFNVHAVDYDTPEIL
jgi:hypothetical protein